MLATATPYRTRAENRGISRALIQRAADYQAWFSMHVNRGMVFYALVVEIMEFRGLGDRM